MKKVTLLLPDKIYRTIGASRWSKTDEIDLTPDTLLLVLTDRSSYHDRYKFKSDDVQILAIESVNLLKKFAWKRFRKSPPKLHP